MNKAAQKINKIIEMGLSPSLKSLGYKKKGANFFLLEADHNFVVNIQARTTGAKGMFAVNLGVSFPSVLKNVKGLNNLWADGRGVSSINERLGVLLYGRDQWWPIDQDIAETSSDVVNAWTKYGAPWLESLSDVEQGCKYYENRGNFFGTAVCYLAMGDKKQSAVFFKKAMKGPSETPFSLKQLEKWGAQNSLV